MIALTSSLSWNIPIVQKTDTKIIIVIFVNCTFIITQSIVEHKVTTACTHLPLNIGFHQVNSASYNRKVDTLTAVDILSWRE